VADYKLPEEVVEDQEVGRFGKLAE
jgi:hypothetical protein